MTTTTETYRIAVIGAGGKMGMRVSDNLAKTDHTVAYVENSPAGAQRTIDAGRELTDAAGPRAVANAQLGLVAGFGMVTYDRCLCTGAVILGRPA